MRKTLEIVNSMQAAGVFNQYALTGAVAAMYYTEPSLTEDIDVLIAFDATGLLTLTPIVDHLRALGYEQRHKEGIVVEGWPIQFLPASDLLDGEALTRACAVEIDLPGGRVSTRVLQAEHLVAIALRTGRPKDIVRIIQLLDANVVNSVILKELLARHDLSGKWEQCRFRHGLGETAP